MRLLPSVALLVALAGCSFSADRDDPPGDYEVAFDGRVTYVTVEGGAWVLRSDAGETYEPLNLQPAFHHEGLRVRVGADVRDDLASYLQVGPIIEIRRIERL